MKTFTVKRYKNLKLTLEHPDQQVEGSSPFRPTRAMNVWFHGKKG
jgi:hypothetical protein